MRTTLMDQYACGRLTENFGRGGHVARQPDAETHGEKGRKQVGDSQENTTVAYMQLHCTVLVLIKLTKNAVSLRFRCGSCKLKFCRFFTMFCDI